MYSSMNNAVGSPTPQKDHLLIVHTQWVNVFGLGSRQYSRLTIYNQSYYKFYWCNKNSPSTEKYKIHYWSPCSSGVWITHSSECRARQHLNELKFKNTLKKPLTGTLSSIHKCVCVYSAEWMAPAQVKWGCRVITETKPFSLYHRVCVRTHQTVFW